MNYKKFYMIKNCLVVMEIADYIVNKVYVINKLGCLTFINRLGAEKFLFVLNQKAIYHGFKKDVDIYIVNENIQTDSMLTFSHFTKKHLFDPFCDIKG